MEFAVATHDDIEELIKMRMFYLYEYFKEITEEQKKSIMEQLPQYFTRHLGKDMMAFVAKENNTIISTAFLVIMEKPANLNFITGTIGEVLNVYTCKEYRRQGIARQLMEMLIDYAKACKLDFLELKATSDGYPLYKKLGFNETQHSGVLMKYMF